MIMWVFFVLMYVNKEWLRMCLAIKHPPYFVNVSCGVFRRTGRGDTLMAFHEHGPTDFFLR